MNLLHRITSRSFTQKGCACMYVFYRMELSDIWSHGGWSCEGQGLLSLERALCGFKHSVLSNSGIL